MAETIHRRVAFRHFYLKYLSMKKAKIFGLLVLMLAGIGTTFAQLKTDERERPAYQQTIQIYREKLQLNETQKEKVDSINNKYISRLTAIKKIGNISVFKNESAVQLERGKRSRNEDSFEWRTI